MWLKSASATSADATSVQITYDIHAMPPSSIYLIMEVDSGIKQLL